MNKVDKLIIPSCSGLLDCFHTQADDSLRQESICWLTTKDCDNLLITALFSFYYIATKNLACPPDTITFKMSELKRFLGYSQGGKSKDLKAELLSHCKVGYIWDQTPCESLIKINFNSTQTLVTMESEYFVSIKDLMKENYSVRDKRGNILYKGKSSYSSLVYVSILKERNIPAVEIVIELVKLIERRGPLSEGQTAHLAIPTLIGRCPTLSNQLESKEVKEQNRILRKALEKALGLLKIHTDVYNCFVNLEVEIPHTVSVRGNEVIVVRYERREFDE